MFLMMSGKVSDPSESHGESIKMVMDSLWAIYKSFLAHLPQIILSALLLVGTWMAAKVLTAIAKKVLLRLKLRASLNSLFLQMIYALVWVSGTLVACMVLFPSLTPGRLIAAFGLGSVAIGFAFRDIFENFFAGILILWRFPFEPGDFIECEGVMGKVVNITIRNTLIRQVDGQLIIVPNAKLFKNPVYVLTSQKWRRVRIICGVDYATNIDKARKVILAAVKSTEGVHQDRPIEVFAENFSESSIDFEVAWWAASNPLEQRANRDKVIAAIKQGLDEAEIQIPFPHRTVQFKAPLEINAAHDAL